MTLPRQNETRESNQRRHTSTNTVTSCPYGLVAEREPFNIFLGGVSARCSAPLNPTPIVASNELHLTSCPDQSDVVRRSSFSILLGGSAASCDVKGPYSMKEEGRTHRYLHPPTFTSYLTSCPDGLVMERGKFNTLFGGVSSKCSTPRSPTPIVASSELHLTSCPDQSDVVRRSSFSVLLGGSAASCDVKGPYSMEEESRTHRYLDPPTFTSHLTSCPDGLVMERGQFNILFGGAPAKCVEPSPPRTLSIMTSPELLTCYPENYRARARASFSPLRKEVQQCVEAEVIADEDEELARAEPAMEEIMKMNEEEEISQLEKIADILKAEEARLAKIEAFMEVEEARFNELFQVNGSSFLALQDNNLHSSSLHRNNLKYSSMSDFNNKEFAQLLYVSVILGVVAALKRFLQRRRRRGGRERSDSFSQLTHTVGHKILFRRGRTATSMSSSASLSSSSELDAEFSDDRAHDVVESSGNQFEKNHCSSSYCDLSPPPLVAATPITEIQTTSRSDDNFFFDASPASSSTQPSFESKIIKETPPPAPLPPPEEHTNTKRRTKTKRGKIGVKEYTFNDGYVCDYNGYEGKIPQSPSLREMVRR